MVGLDSTPQTDMSSYGSLRDDKVFSLDQAILHRSGGVKKVSMSSQAVMEDDGDEGLLDATDDSIEAEDEVKDVVAEDAKRDRKVSLRYIESGLGILIKMTLVAQIADLEISNKSLMTINRNLEGELECANDFASPLKCLYDVAPAEAARKNRLIISLKRQLRASAAGPPEGDAADSSNAPRRSLGLKADLDDDIDALDFDENDEVAQECLREAGILETSLDKANDALEALIKKGKEALRKVEDIKEGAKGKVLGVLELEEQEAKSGDSDGGTEAETPPSHEDETIEGRALNEVPSMQATDEGRNAATFPST